MTRKLGTGPTHDRGRPGEKAPSNGVSDDNRIVASPADVLADLDAVAEQLRGRFAVQVTVNDLGHVRTYLYRSAGAAERCVERARQRGRTAHVSVVQLLPVGVVVGIGGGR